MNNRILVTGGAGFVGSHACKALARAGYLPITFDSLERGHEWAVKWGPLERGDLREEKDLRRAFEEWRPRAVMHFAAYAYVGESTVEPAKYYDINVGGTAKLLQACVAFGCDNIVFSSSCATYGIPARLPLKEDDAQAPVNPYGYTKLVVERMLKEAEAAHGIRHTALRYFNAAGADPDGEIGEMHDPETHLVPLVLFAAMGRLPSIKIFGDDYSTPDGTCVRDYVHVSDLADAHVAAIDWLAEGMPSDTFNLGNGQGFSVTEVVRAGERIAGRPVRSEICPRRDGDPPKLVSDSTRARELLNWNPRFPSLDQQIGHAWEWFRDRMPKGISG
ncbi:UDP-L-arabinose 4-epimerase [Rhizobiales bacterium GAS113]|jgi:UDP-arabinose 4-epimerase|nr:UDP-L-arabinose 4-epimerase [Rhizobiales bacterium GAS113]